MALYEEDTAFDVCRVISEIPVRIKRVGRHRRIPIRHAGNLLPEEAHQALERDALHHAFLARVPIRQNADLAHRLVHDVEARLLIRFLQKLGDAVKLVQQPALANPALVGSGYFSPVSSSASWKSASRSYRSSSRLCRSLNLRS